MVATGLERERGFPLKCQLWLISRACLGFTFKKESEALWERVRWLISNVCQGPRNRKWLQKCHSFAFFEIGLRLRLSLSLPNIRYSIIFFP